MSSNSRDVEQQNAQADKEPADQARPLVTVPEPNRAGVISKGDTGKPKEYEYRCDHPTKDEADTCSQWRSPNAAEEQVNVSWWGLGASLVSAIATAVAAVAAGMAATSAAGSNKIARDTAKRELRAYISVYPESISIPQSGDRINCISARIQNHGHSPASSINHKFGIDILDNPIPENFSFPTPELEICLNASLPPNCWMLAWFNVNINLTPDVVDRISKNSSRLHLWGVTRYVDAFGDPRETRFTSSVGGQDFITNMKTVRRGEKIANPFNFEWGDGHNSGT